MGLSSSIPIQNSLLHFLLCFVLIRLTFRYFFIGQIRKKGGPADISIPSVRGSVLTLESGQKGERETRGRWREESHISLHS